MGAALPGSLWMPAGANHRKWWVTGENRKGAVEMKRAEMQQECIEGQKEEEEGSPPWLVSSQTLWVLVVFHLKNKVCALNFSSSEGEDCDFLLVERTCFKAEILWRLVFCLWHSSAF